MVVLNVSTELTARRYQHYTQMFHAPAGHMPEGSYEVSDGTGTLLSSQLGFMQHMRSAHTVRATGAVDVIILV